MQYLKTSILISGIKLPLHVPEADAVKEARRILRGVHLLSQETELSVYRRSVDARRRENIFFVYTVKASGLFPRHILEKNKALFPRVDEAFPMPIYGEIPLDDRPMVVGSGPAGLFAALLLAEHGYRPVLIERGGSVAERKVATEAFRTCRILDPETNIQYGAGGAGTFSDGKLVTRIRDPLSAYVMETFVSLGAPKEILTLAKPHIGTDILEHVVENMLSRIEQAGGEVLFHTKLTDIRFSGNRAVSVLTNRGEIPIGALVLATGHSARDTYQMLLSHPFAIEPKPFSVGMRIEHRQEDIDRALYGKFAGDPRLGHAEYALSHNTKERGVYTFCMCPGGEVVAAASEEGGVVVNGMSRHARDGKNANSAVLCSVFREDYGNTPTGAIAMQRRIEQAAFLAGGKDYAAPMITVGDFLADTCQKEPSYILPTYMEGKGVRLASASSYLPAFVTTGIKNALTAFGRQIEGFDRPDAVLTGAETRSSAPVRILRGEDRVAIGMQNVYPSGEGAGYAGGITSAAIDGVRTALALMAKYRQDKN